MNEQQSDPNSLSLQDVGYAQHQEIQHLRAELANMQAKLAEREKQFTEKERRPVGASDDPRHPAVKPCERLSDACGMEACQGFRCLPPAPPRYWLRGARAHGKHLLVIFKIALQRFNHQLLLSDDFIATVDLPLL